MSVQAEETFFFKGKAEYVDLTQTPEEADGVKSIRNPLKTFCPPPCFGEKNCQPQIFPFPLTEPS